MTTMSMDRRAIKVHREPSRDECLSAIKMTLIRFNAFVQEMDRQRYYSPGKFTAEHRDFLYEMSDRQYLRNMNAVLTGGQLEELDDEALETVLEKCRRLSDRFGLCVDIPEGARIADEKTQSISYGGGNDVLELDTWRTGSVDRIVGMADMSGLKKMIPKKYYERAQNSISNMPEKQRQEVMEFIGELYQKNGDPRKTMQEHHWIEQSRIKDTKTYPFLSCPPMKEDLLKSKSNLSLIVGHNGGHKKTYNDLLDERLTYIKDSLEQQYMKQNISLEALMQDNNVKSWINEEIEKTIAVLQDAVKRDHKIMNNVEKMFILD